MLSISWGKNGKRYYLRMCFLSQFLRKNKKKKNELEIHETTWWNFKIIMLSESNQTKESIV